MSALVFDTETTDVDAPEIVEAAYIELDDGLSACGHFSQNYKPSKPISLGAMAVHHIMDEDVVDCPPSSSFALPAGTEYLIGHNIDFDWRAIGEPKVKRICTLALARSLWPSADSHTLSALTYLLDRENARRRLRNVHNALADVQLCHELLIHISTLLNVQGIEGLWQASEKARVPTHMPFGKHKGMAIAEVPRDYRDWLLRQPDVDPYLTKALREAR